MKLYNDTSYKYTAFINGKEYFLDRKSTIAFECNTPTRVVLTAKDKNRVFINVFDLLLEMFFGSSTVTLAYCDYAFTIKDYAKDVITLKDNSWNPREQLGIHSCYADCEVENEQYTIHNFQKLNRKHRNMHIFVTSLLPVGIFLLILMLIFKAELPFILAFFVWFLIFPALGVKEMKRFKEATEPDLLNQTLCRYAGERKQGKVFVSEDTSKTGKFINNIIGKMFKFDEDK